MWPALSLRMLGLRFDAHAAIDLAARFRFQGVELLIRDLVEQNEDVAVLASMMDDLGLRGGSWPLPVDWKGESDRFRRDLSLLPAYARIAAQLGLNRTGTWVLPEILDPGLLEQEQPREAAVAWHLERLVPIATILSDHGHRLGLEAIGVSSFQTGRGLRFIDRLEAVHPLLRMLRDRGCDVGVTVDSFHLYAAMESPEIVRQFDPEEIVSVHVSDVLDNASHDLKKLQDNQRSLPSTAGPVPNRSLLQILAELGDSGPVFPEPVVGGGVYKMTLGPLADQEAVVQLAAEALQSIWPRDSS